MRSAALTALLLLAISTACANDEDSEGFFVETARDSTVEPSTRAEPSSTSEASTTAEPTASPEIMPEPTLEEVPSATETPLAEQELRLNSTAFAAGSTILASVSNAEGGGTAYFGGREYPLVDGGGFLWAIMGLGPDAAPGTAGVSVTLNDGATFETSLQIGEAGYPVKNITLSGETTSLLTPDNAATERAKVGAAYTVFTPKRLWVGPFIYPVDTYITAGYGDARSYNGGPVGSYHKGIDFGALEGTPILASNSGRVILAEALPLSGNSVIVDHGLGVMTLYAHMVRIDVSNGDSVVQGQVLGEVGSTGISTGSHLHWGVLIRGVPVNPHQWTFTEMGP